MLELEIMLRDLGKLYDREKGLRNKILLENAIVNLKEYERAISNPEATYLVKKAKE